MSSAREGQFPRVRVHDAVPNREEHVVLPVHGKREVERSQDGGGIREVHVRHRAVAEDVHDGDGQQGRADSMTADVQHVEGEAAFIQPVIAERVAAELITGQEAPVGDHETGQDRFWQKRADVLRGLGELRGQGALAGLQGLEGGAFTFAQLPFLEARVDARLQEHRIKRLGQIILRAHFNAAGHA